MKIVKQRTDRGETFVPSREILPEKPGLFPLNPGEYGVRDGSQKYWTQPRWWPAQSRIPRQPFSLD